MTSVDITLNPPEITSHNNTFDKSKYLAECCIQTELKIVPTHSSTHFNCMIFAGNDLCVSDLYRSADVVAASRYTLRAKR